MNIKCGKCKQYHESFDQVRACNLAPAKQQFATERVYEAPEFPDSTKYLNGGKFVSQKVEFPTVPESKYALANLPGHANALTFFQVQTGKKGKWKGFQFVNRLVGGGVGSFVEYPVKGAAKAQVLRKIADDPQAAAKAFADEFSVCARCGRTLTDDTSRARGLGPDCAAVFG